jgi:precorrin-4/cobalt-precorrin-4 C11-methyltransferase
MTAQVYFIGAGPGDPELLTIKAKRLIERADVIIFADSLINPVVCSFARREAEIYRSASLDLEEITRIIENAVSQGKTVARLQSGDPSIYGAIREQIAALEAKGIDCEVIPGVSSLFAATAALKAELTVPDVSQTVIITRMEGRTPVPAEERLKGLAAHHTSLAIFLSAALADKVAVELIDGGYQPATPAAVVYRASWPDEQIIRTTLETLAEDMKNAGIKKQALILIGSFLESCTEKRRSKLYDRKFNHEYRENK